MTLYVLLSTLVTLTGGAGEQEGRFSAVDAPNCLEDTGKTYPQEEGSRSQPVNKVPDPLPKLTQ